MALMYSWATKEYLLWEMSLVQIVLYHNIGIDIKYPTPKGDKPSLRNMDKQTVQKAIDEAKRNMADADRKQSDDAKEMYREKYGDV